MQKYLYLEEFEQSLLNEASYIGGEEWESIIVYCWNLKNFPDDPKAKYNEEAIEIGNKIAKNLEKYIPKGTRLKIQGKTKGAITPFWKEHGGLDGTSKTDVISTDGKLRLSLKKKGPYQLMTAGNDAIPTLVSAFNKCANAKLEGFDQFRKKFQEFEEDFKKSAFTLRGEEYTIEKFGDIMDKFKTKLNITDKEELKELSKKEFAGKLRELIKSVFTDNDQQLMIRGMFDRYRLDKKLDEILHSYKFFNRMFIGEAITGLMKFGYKSDNAANAMLIFDADKGDVNFKEVVDKSGFLLGDNIADLLKGHHVTIHVTWKARNNASSGGHGDYTRMVVQQQVDAGDFSKEWKFYNSQFESIAMDSFYELEDDINEGLLDFASVLVGWLKRIIAKLSEKVLEWAQQGLEHLLEIAGLEIAKVEVSNVAFSV